MAEIRMDGYENIATGRGIYGRDKMVHGTFSNNIITDRTLLEAMYTSNGIFKRIVDLIVDDSLKDDLDISPKLADEFDRLDVVNKVHEMAYYSRLFGGAAILAITSDNSPLSEELDLKSLKKVERLIVLNRYSVQSLKYDEDIDSDTFGDLTHYSISFQFMNKTSVTEIHASRILTMKGEWAPVASSRFLSDWGLSCLQFCHKAIQNYIHISGLIPNLLDEYMLTLVKIKGLFESYASGKEDKIAKRLADANFSKSVDNIILMDAEYEDFERTSGNTAGFSELVSDIMHFVSAETGIPATILFGRSPQGMNATGESDREIWHSQVETYRTKKIAPVINGIVKLIVAQSEYKSDYDSDDWQFKPLEILSEQELADVRLKNAQADVAYSEAGGADIAYLFHKRHDGGYSSELNYSLEDYTEFSSDFDVKFESHKEMTETLHKEVDLNENKTDEI